MLISEIINYLETLAPPAYQESYDNCGLITGNGLWHCTSAVCTLDVTEAVVKEAIENNCNLIIAHHPIIFKGLKKINGNNYVEKTIISAIKNDIAIYAIHTNLDNVIDGVNKRIADKIGLINTKILAPKNSLLTKLFIMVPHTHAQQVRNAIFNAGGGDISNYSNCSFNISGIGTFMPQHGADPFDGEIGKLTEAEEVKIEVLFPSYLKNKILQAAVAAHPYEEVAYDLINLDNDNLRVGSGIIGELEKPLAEADFLNKIKIAFGLKVIKHTALRDKNIQKVAVCGGAGSFLMRNAIAARADVYITSDIKYHEFFDAEGKMVIADIGHYESEQFTADLLVDILKAKFPNFALRKSGVNTNPVQYFT